MNQRTVNIGIAIFLVVTSLYLQTQIAHLPREGKLFPQCILYLLTGCGVLFGLRALFAKDARISFFGDVSPLRWLLITGIFTLEVFGAMYVSFFLCMGLGIFLMLVALTPRRTAFSFVVNVMFTAGFLLFFKLFFTDIMYISFPEYVFG